MIVRHGGCLCGSVTYQVSGEPLRVGICHCSDCRREGGSAFTFFGIWPSTSFKTSGMTTELRGRRFCPACGSRLFSLRETEAEIRLGTLEHPPTDLAPSFELWVKRREPWLPPLPQAEQYREDRP
jgi:hypothetical protein